MFPSLIPSLHLDLQALPAGSADQAQLALILAISQKVYV